MDNILNISEAASLAMHASAYLACNGEGRLPIKSIAKKLGRSEHHLSKVMQRLTRAGIVSSIRGPGGGFSLAKDPEAITLLDVFEAIQGPYQPQTCLFPQPVCTGEACILGGLICKTASDVKDHLRSTRLSDLVDVYSLKERP
jgi:Rrf2 family protein